MKLGFVSAILPDLNWREVVEFASTEEVGCVEVMCWPVGKAERRYAGVTHLDVTGLNQGRAEEFMGLAREKGVVVSGLGYYPNVLSPDEEEANRCREHLERVIVAAGLTGVGLVNTFVGRDWRLSVEENWPRFEATWKPLLKLAEDHGVKVAIENCPMLFSKDEWPGGKNLATSPKIWRRMFEAIGSESFGLNFDPSHLIWQGMDVNRAIREFGSRFFHVHAKDVRVDRHRLDEVGFLAHPLEYHVPKLPGLGDVDWKGFFSYLTESGYDGPVCVEVEDRAFEGSLEKRKESIRLSRNYLKQFFG